MQIKADPDADEVATVATEEPNSPGSPAPATPEKNRTPKKVDDFGSVATPGGRRSARIASKSATKKRF